MALQDVIATVENCRYCLMCRHVAPVGVITHLETLTPHGIALTIASQRRGLIDWHQETVGVVYADPDGGNSRAHCVTDQPLPEAIAAVRAEIVAAGLAPPVVYALRDRLADGRSPFGEKTDVATSRHADDALFVTDEAIFLWPAAVPAARRLLAAAGIEPAVVAAGSGSGFLASTLGLPDIARAMATRVQNDVATSGARRVLVLTPGDYFTLGQLYDERLGITWPADVSLTEVITVLADRLAAGQLRFLPADDADGVAYVDPTHAVRVPARFDAVRTLATEVLGRSPLELFWRRERAHPVGSTGLQFTHPDIAEKLTRSRLIDAGQRGARILLCEDPATLHHLDRHAAEYGLRVLGMYEWLADHLAAEN